MPKFSNASKEQLETLHPKLRAVMEAAIQHIDFKVLEGYRGKERQNDAFSRGLSNLRWPNGKHNQSPSVAVDIAPWPVDWHDSVRFIYFAGQIVAISRCMGIALRWGGDWDSDTELHDQKLMDYGHFELVD